jgi:hypothetical protein
VLPHSLLAIANPITPEYLDDLHNEFTPLDQEKDSFALPAKKMPFKPFKCCDLTPWSLNYRFGVPASQGAAIRDSVEAIAPLIPFVLTAKRNFPKFSFTNRMTPFHPSSLYWLKRLLSASDGIIS